MSLQLYFLVIAVTALAVSVLFLWREARRSFNENGHATQEGSSLPFVWDPLTSELSARIFDSEDSDFVASESSPQTARAFQEGRTALALDWLREVRRQVNLLMRAHLRAARVNAGLKPSSELRLGFEFLLFQVTSGIFYLVVWLIGPLHAARFVGHSLELARQVREMTEDILPGTPVAVELLDSEPKVKSRAASS